MEAPCFFETSANTTPVTRHMPENLQPKHNRCGNPSSRHHPNILHNKSGANKLYKNAGDTSKIYAPEE